MTTPSLASIARPSGGLAMLAVDQREALRTMLASARGVAISDADMTTFKTDATRILSPYASGVLVDRDFALEAVVRDGAIAPSCALIAAADQFLPGNGLPVDRVQIDDGISAAHAKSLGAKAMKLLVLYRSDEPAEERRALVDDFVQRCHEEDLLAIIEPVVRPPRTHAEFDKEQAIVDAAKELGDSGADLYKGEMPRGGQGTDIELLDACRRLNDSIAMPWVILSSGVTPDLFPNAVRQAMRAGAIGFLAGRAVWSTTLASPSPLAALRDLAAPRLRRLGEIVDETIAER